MREKREVQGADADSRSWGDWQRDWFSTPGDIDDFIFYDDQREAREDPDP